MTREKSDLSRAFSEDGARKTHVGGQALLEGIMMRGKYNWSVAVREPSGAVYTEEHDLASGKEKNGWLYWPLVRGCRALVESLVLGFKALEIATLHAYAEEDEGEEKAEEKPVSGTACEAACEQPTRQESELEFSWRDDFGRPDTVIDALGAQSSLEDGKIRLPFGSLDGVGEAAAESLQHARDGGPYISVEDLRIRSKISKSVIETLRAVGALDCLPETSQITLF